MNTINLKHLLIATTIILFTEIGARMVVHSIINIPTMETILIIRIVEIIVFLVLTIKINSSLLITYRFDKFMKRGIWTGILWSFYLGAFSFIVAILIQLTTQINTISLFKSPLLSDLINQKERFSLTIFFLTSCIVSPIAEELFFRGFIYLYLRRYGMVVAIVISTLIFTICHIKGNITILVIQPIIGGIIFALSYEYSKSLAAPIIIHQLGNTAIFTLGLLQEL